MKKKTTKRSNKPKRPPRSNSNGYQKDSNYGLCFDVLAQMGRKKPIARKSFIEAYAKLSGKDTKRASYDCAVILSPTSDGKFHRSADSAMKKFPHYVDRLGDGMVQLVIKK